MSVQLHPDIETLDKESLCYSIYAQLCSPPLTTVAVDTDAIARLAAKRMIKHMNEPQKKGGEVYRIPGKIIYRDSVCKING